MNRSPTTIRKRGLAQMRYRMALQVFPCARFRRSQPTMDPPVAFGDPSPRSYDCGPNSLGSGRWIKICVAFCVEIYTWQQISI